MTSPTPDPRHRRSIRLETYDYAQAGAYFVTIVTQDRACLFGQASDGAVDLSEAGQMVAAAWVALPTRFPTIDLDEFVVMPNHLHGIIVLSAPSPSGRSPTLGAVVGAFKSIVTVEYGRGVRSGRWPPFRGRLWQRNYYEHVIRGEAGLDRIRRYIDENPIRWELDAENPGRVVT